MPKCKNYSFAFSRVGILNTTPNQLSITINGLGNQSTSTVKFDFQGMFNYANVNTITFSEPFPNAEDVSHVLQMFDYCKVKTIYAVNNLSFSDTENIFTDCINLIGGAGTAYVNTHITNEYARIDGDGGPGYFTRGVGSDPFNPDKPGELTSDYPDYSLGTGYMQYGDTNMVTIFTPTEAQLQYLQEKFYGENFIDYIFTSAAYAALGATDCLLSLSVFPFNITKAGTKYLKSK